MKVNPINEGLRYGIILGVFGLLIMYGSWSLGMDMFIKLTTWSAFIPYIIITLIIAGLQLRKKNDDVLKFKEALQFTFLTYVIIAVIIGIGTYVLYNVIDKDLTQRSFEASMQKTEDMLKGFGMSEEKVEDAMEKARSQDQDTGLKKILLGISLGLIWDFIKSLLISLIIRKEEKIKFETNANLA